MGLASKLAAFAARLTSDSKVPQTALAANVAGNGPAFSAYQSSSQTLSANTYTKIQFHTEEFDTNNNFDNATNYRFQPTIAGYYQINTQIQVGSIWNNMGVFLYKNGSVFKNGWFGLNSTANANAGIQGNWLVYLNGSTDYVEIYGAVSAAQGLLLGGSSQNFFQGFLARAA